MGAVIHQTPAVLETNDGMHQLSCRSLKIGFNTVVPLLSLMGRSNNIKAINQKTTRKL